jgi:mono/diheme cytochrome c family protein
MWLSPKALRPPGGDVAPRSEAGKYSDNNGRTTGLMPWEGCVNGKTGVLALGLSLLQAGALAALTAVASLDGATAQDAAPQSHYDGDIAPIFAKNCVGCHSGAQPQGDILLRFKDEADARSRAVTNDEFWDKVADEVESGRMPPAASRNKPSDGERKLLVDWIKNDVLSIGGKPDPGPAVVHRLNNREYANTIRELLYLPASYDAAADFPADERGDGFDNNSDTLVISPLLIERYLAANEKAVNSAFKPADEEKGVLSGIASPQLLEPGKDFKADFANSQAHVRLNLEAFMPRAWRRPVTKEEVEGMMKFVAMGFAHDGESKTKALALAIRATLMSPNFLFRLEMDPAFDGSGKVYALSEHQLASRLSYFLWSSMPDAALTADANAGTLRRNLDAQVARMLKDPKAVSLTRDFLGQWLEIRGLESTPNVDKALLGSMKRETETFFNYIVANDRPITDMLFADYSFVDARLAKLYGIPNITGDEFQKVQLDPKQRGGIITQASFLTLTSKPLGDGLRTSPVVRGKFILENLFNQKIPPPPPNVPALALDTSKQLKGTVRQIFEQHRDFPSCAGCHARMDPYGFALENYSGIGEWRDKDNGIAVDASGDINGRKFTTPAEFRQVLETRKADFRRAVVRKVFSYALGRGIQGVDRPAIEQIVAAVEKDGDRFSSVIANVVKSYPFQNARNGLMSSRAGGAASDKKVANDSVLKPINFSGR